MRTALRGGVVNYLLKPFDQDALRDRLQQYAADHRSLDAPTVAQSDLDQLFGVRAGPPGAAAAAEGAEPGVGRPRRGGAAHAAPRTTCRPRSAPSAPGLSRVSARRYLEHFVEIGRAEVRLRYGAAGRPQRRYAWKPR